MKALKIIVIILVVILAVVLIPPLFMPSEMYVEKTLVMEAEPEVVWDQVYCLENWEQWDVWHQDSNIVGEYVGPECGVGAKNIWTYKNRDDGGSQEIVEARDNEYIRTHLDFQEMGTAESEFLFEEVDGGTKVTWNLRSDGSYPVMRWINTLMVKPGVSKSYEEGLKNLNEFTMNMEPKPKYKTGDISIKEVKPMDALAYHSVAGMAEIGQEMGNAFGKISAYIQSQNGVEMAGAPRAIWYSWEGEEFEFDNVIPVSKAVGGNDEIKAIKTYGGKAAFVSHTGNYESTQYSWEALENYIKSSNLKTNGDPWEVYITDPMSEPDQSKWVTELYWPVK